MNEILIFIQLFNDKQIHDIWITDSYIVEDFLKQVVLLWCKDTYDYEHFFVLTYNDQIIDSSITFKENGIVSGDHLLLI